MYEAVVRDKIPEIIKAGRRDCDTLIVAGEEKYKLLEEREEGEFVKRMKREIGPYLRININPNILLNYSEIHNIIFKYCTKDRR